jgi:hypothetical protein
MTERVACPYCHGSNGIIALMSIYHCNACEKSFTPLESKQAQIIQRLREEIKTIKKQKRGIR